MAKVLVVDDEKAIRVTLQAFIQAEGHAVQTAADPREALELLSQGAFDVVVSDIIMPNMSGIELLSAIRKTAPDVEVVLITGEPNVDTAISAVKDGAYDYLPKPVAGDTVSRVVTNAAQTKALRDENERLMRENQRYTVELEARVAERTQALRRSQQELAAVINEAPDGMITVDDDGIVRAFNPAAVRITGISQEHAIGRKVHDVDVFRRSDDAGASLADIVTGAVLGSHEIDLVRDDGEVRHLECISRRAQSGPQTHTTFRDHTEKKRAEAALGELEAQFLHAQRLESVGRLAGGIAHDFNNLLTVIRSAVELTQDELAGAGGTIDVNLVEIADAAERAAALTRQLLAFSRRQVMHPVKLDLNEIVVEFAKSLGRALGERVALRTELCRDLAEVKLDPDQIRHAMMNIAVNARDAMPRGGELLLRTDMVDADEALATQLGLAHPGLFVSIAMADNGVGIDAQTLGRIFEPFFSTKPAHRGRGLGLSTVHGIVAQSGGAIVVDSAVGEGTCVTMYFPACTQPRPVAERWRDDALPAGTETILLVESEENVRRLATAVLKRLGYHVIAAQNVESALKLAEQAGSLDLVLTDAALGDNLAHPPQSLLDIHGGVRVLYTSAFASRVVVRGETHTDIAFVERPFTIAALAKKVRETLDG